MLREQGRSAWGSGLRGIVVAALLAGCAEPSRPPLAAEGAQYALWSVDTLTPPIFVGAVGPVSTFIDAETVTLREDGIATFHRRVRTVDAGAGVQTTNHEFGLSYAVTGDSISLTNGLVCVTIPCPRVDLRGTVSDSVLWLRGAGGTTRVWTYHRVTAGSAAP